MKILRTLPHISHTTCSNFFLLAGPCVVEGEGICFDIARRIKEITDRLQIPFVFKGSFKKTNCSHMDTFTGIGDRNALQILADIRENLHVPVATDIHTEADAALAAEYVDVLQIPAFLCRQTDLLIAAAKTGKMVNITKDQFEAPKIMKFAADKVIQSGNNRMMLTDCGTMFGYYDLVVDYRGIKRMQETGLPVVLDITHSLQQPNITEDTPDLPQQIEIIARAGIAIGVDGISMETHPDPIHAGPDGTNMLPLDQLEGLLRRLVKIRQAINGF